MYQVLLASYLWLLVAVQGAVVEYTWNIGWVQAAPDGYQRSVIGINGHWPCPTLQATKGDRIIIHVTNSLGNQTLGLHWHGIDQVGTNFMDGTVMGAQCPLPPGRSMTYNFTANSAGTYWYHSHDFGQYPDGLRGPFIIRDPADPFKGQFSTEYTLTLTDWYHNQSYDLVRNELLIPSNTLFKPPFPDNLLLNDGAPANYVFKPGQTYRLRIFNFGAIASFMLHFQNHNMTVIQTDASYTKPQSVNMLRIIPGQRYDILLTAGKTETTNSPFLVAMDVNKDYRNASLPIQWPHNQTGYLVANPSAPLNAQDVITKFTPFDESKFAPLVYSPLPPPDQTFQLDFSFCFDSNNIPRACFDDNQGDPGPYVPPKVPTLLSAISTGSNNFNRAVYGHVHPMIVKKNQVIDLVVNMHGDPATHPFHMHGHQFEILVEAPPSAGVWPGPSKAVYNPNPPRRDTYAINGLSYAVIRFRADNPGVWLYHCHIEWHVEMGLVATLIEAPDVLAATLGNETNIPPEQIQNCKTLGIPYAGNAGGNTVNVLDTSGIPSVNEYPYHGSQYP